MLFVENEPENYGSIARDTPSSSLTSASSTTTADVGIDASDETRKSIGRRVLATKRILAAVGIIIGCCCYLVFRPGHAQLVRDEAQLVRVEQDLWRHSRSSSSSSNTVTETTVTTTTTTHNSLPSYLTAIEPGTPEYETLDPTTFNVTSTFIIGNNPGDGNIIPGQATIVRFNRPRFLFRAYGGGASQCGRWWSLTPPSGDRDTYFHHFGICSNWNNADHIVRCVVPTNYTTIVGPGQSADCDGGPPYLTPDPSNLQLNGDICTEATKVNKHLACSYCHADDFHLEESECSNRLEDYIDEFDEYKHNH